ncbi:MAG: hypothetical protein H0X16_05700 [Chloroflexi bacterium]|nr:hypothetical protein [Chloroflexota bacterium]
MPHPTLGLPPDDATAGLPRAADTLRRERLRLARLALEAALRIAPDFRDRYEEIDLRQFLRDYEQHVEQLARAMETGNDSFVTMYAEWLVPVYRRREVPIKDQGVLLLGLRDAVATVLAPEDGRVANDYLYRWRARLARHGALPGDHKGNGIVRFFWKGAGLGDRGTV